jgi:hypothetical protein
MTRGRVSVIRDPAIAAAAGKCWLARWNGGKGASRMLGIPVNSFHPQDCGFCEYPTDRLLESVDEFVKWAGLKPPEAMDEIGVIRESVEMFMAQPAHEQSRLVMKAQGYFEADDEEE